MKNMKKTKKGKLTAHKILITLEDNIDKIRKYKVKKLGLFGSFAKNKQKKKSDIDFLVVFDRPTFDNYMDTKFLLERLFHRKVDLVAENGLKPGLQYVKKEALYAKRL